MTTIVLWAVDDQIARYVVKTTISNISSFVGGPGIVALIPVVCFFTGGNSSILK
jgi:hypothetical protein